MNLTPLDDLTFSRWSDAVHTPFLVRVPPAAEARLQLLHATPGPGSSTRDASSLCYECFSLLFQGPETPLLPQGIHLFEHEQLGCFELFIVPVGRSGGGFQYQAVFNRLLGHG
jgi:hypothetical protein